MREAQRSHDPNDWLRRVRASELPFGTKGVLAVLRTYMDKTGGSCFPSLEEIGRSCSLNKRTVTHHLKPALREGWLIRQGSRGRGRTFYYPAIPRILRDVSRQPVADFDAEVGNPCDATRQPVALSSATGCHIGTQDQVTTNGAADYPQAVVDAVRAELRAEGTTYDGMDAVAEDRLVRSRLARRRQNHGLRPTGTT